MARPLNRYDPFASFRGQVPAGRLGRWETPSRDTERRLRQAENELARLHVNFNHLRRQIMADLKALLDKLEEQNTVSAGYRAAVDTKLTELKAEIDRLTAGQVDAATQARIDDAFAKASADTDADKEATAILKGTPAEGTPVDQPSP